jgi:hypothetical protein
MSPRKLLKTRAKELKSKWISFSRDMHYAFDVVGELTILTQ